jgi:hypothetical protein
MADIPASPKIYHITHVDNLRQIVQSGVLWSDAKRVVQGLDCEIVGIPEIKRRRLEELSVPCHPGTRVGEYVPFYFCPRSIMLYILHMSNHPDITYRAGQESIVHLMADLHATVGWADANRVMWAFSDRNAGIRYTRFFSNLASLSEVNWDAVQAADFRDPQVKDGKQAEFLLYESFPYELVAQVGVQNASTKAKVEEVLVSVDHQPLVTVEPRWYY